MVYSITGKAKKGNDLLKKYIEGALFILLVAIVFCYCCVVYDYCNYLRSGHFSLFPEFNLARFKFGETNKETMKIFPSFYSYFNDLYENGYNPFDLLHTFVSLTLCVAIFCPLLFLITKSAKMAIPPSIAIACIIANLLASILVISIRAFSINTFAEPEVKMAYPIAFLFERAPLWGIVSACSLGYALYLCFSHTKKYIGE